MAEECELTDGLRRRLIQLECQLHHVERHNPVVLNQCLHTDFKEFTQSGRVLNKCQMMAALLAEQDANKIHAQDFQLQFLSSHSALLTYLSHQVHAQTQTQYNWALRSSIWHRNEQDVWQLLFHQGTPCAKPIEPVIDC